jgi:hypothetical protein
MLAADECCEELSKNADLLDSVLVSGGDDAEVSDNPYRKLLFVASRLRVWLRTVSSAAAAGLDSGGGSGTQGPPPSSQMYRTQVEMPHTEARMQMTGFEESSGVWSGHEAVTVLAACGLRRETVDALRGTIALPRARAGL